MDTYSTANVGWYNKEINIAIRVKHRGATVMGQSYDYQWLSLCQSSIPEGYSKNRSVPNQDKM